MGHFHFFLLFTDANYVFFVDITMILNAKLKSKIQIKTKGRFCCGSFTTQDQIYLKCFDTEPIGPFVT